MPAKVRTTGAQDGIGGAATLGSWTPASEVRRNGDVDLLRVGQSKVIHVPDEVALAPVATKARVVAFLLRDGRDATTVVVVRGIEQAFVRQRENLLVDRLVEAVRVALLKVGAAR